MGGDWGRHEDGEEGRNTELVQEHDMAVVWMRQPSRKKMQRKKKGGVLVILLGLKREKEESLLS